MIYEIRMTVSFSLKGVGTEYSKGDGLVKVPMIKKTRTTLIDYIEADGVGEAFNKAAEYKHEVIIRIAKGESDLWTKKAWGERSDNISISLDAVVCKPEIVLMTARKEGKLSAIAELKRIERLAKEIDVPVSILIQMGKLGYRVVKIEE